MATATSMVGFGPIGRDTYPAVWVERVKAHTTVKWKDIHEKKHVLRCHRFDSDAVLWLPRAYGIEEAWGNERIYEEFAEGEPMPVELSPIKLRAYQKPWVDKIVKLFQDDEHDIVAQAGVGKGKTVMSLEIARRLDQVPLVVVDQEFLKNQWIERAKEFLGLTDDQIGIVQGKRCDYEGKALVVGLLQSLYQKDYPRDFYNYFGLVIFDEVHTVGAMHFSRVLELFPAKYRLGVSATPNRDDALNKVLKLHLGKVQVKLEQSHRKSTLRIINYDGVLSRNVNMSPRVGRYISEISEDTDRNWLIARAAARLYEQDHHLMVISDRIEQLHILLEMCVLNGVPREVCGMVTGSEFRWGYDKNPFPRVKPEGWDGKVAFTPVCLQVLSREVPRAVLEERKNSKQVLFTTYSLFSKGVDVPRLSAGIEATPRSKATQVHGRVLREQDGKLTPVWVTIRDRMSYKAEYQLMKRLHEYSVNNVEIVQWHLDKGLRQLSLEPLLAEVKQRNQQLRQAEILMQRDGSYTLATRSTAIASRSGPASITARPTPRRKAS